MRILFLTPYYWPDETGIAFYARETSEYFAARGHEVTVATTFPFYPEWRVREPYRGKFLANDSHAGVRILRTYSYVPRRVTSLRRVIHEASYVAGSMVRALLDRRPDLIFAISPPLGLAVSAAVLRRLWRVPLIFNVSDMQPDAALDLGMLPGPVVKVLFALERFAYRDATIISTINLEMKQRIVAKGVPEGKVTLFPISTDDDLLALPLDGGGASFRKTFDIGERFLVLHSGNMGVKQGLEVIVDAAARCQNDPNIVFVLAGNGATREALAEKAAQLNLRNLLFLGVQPKAEFADMLAAADVCLVTQRRSVSDILFPGKILSIMAAGRPLIASVAAETAAARVVNESGGGVVVEPEDPGLLVAALETLRADKHRRDQMGLAGRNYARQQWGRDKILPAMEEEFTKLIAGAKLSKQPA